MTDQALIDRYGPGLDDAEYAMLEHFREAREAREKLERVKGLIPFRVSTEWWNGEPVETVTFKKRELEVVLK